MIIVEVTQYKDDVEDDFISTEKFKITDEKEKQFLAICGMVNDFPSSVVQRLINVYIDEAVNQIQELTAPMSKH